MCFSRYCHSEAAICDKIAILHAYLRDKHVSYLIF